MVFICFCNKNCLPTEHIYHYLFKNICILQSVLQLKPFDYENLFNKLNLIR